MKNKIILSTILLIVLGSFLISSHASPSSFNIELEGLFNTDSRNVQLNQSLNAQFAINTERVVNEIDPEIELLIKRTTYLLLGSPDRGEESSMEFFIRRTEFESLRYDPVIPLNEEGEYDQNSQEWRDSSVAGFIRGVFNVFADFEITWDYFGHIRVLDQPDGFIASISVPRVRYRIANPERPMEFVWQFSDLTIFYWFKWNADVEEYQLFFTTGELGDALDEFFADAEASENQGVRGIRTNDDNQLASLFDFSRLNALSEDHLTRIYEHNIENIMILNSVYNRGVIDIGTGFLLTNNVLVTSWAYLEYALANASFITVRDREGNAFELIGIINIDIVSDIALIKIDDTGRNGVTLGSSTNMVTEDPLININTQSGHGLVLQAGIVMANDGELQNLLPANRSSLGSPLFNSNGEVIGITNSRSINTSISYASHTDVLISIQENIRNTNQIDVVSFEDLKEQYFLMQDNAEVITNNVGRRTWNRFARIGNIEETIPLPITKANYRRGVLSLRYENNVNSFINNWQMISPFINELRNDGFEEILNTTDRRIFQNRRYQVVIMNKFDYIIIVMVRL